MKNHSLFDMQKFTDDKISAIDAKFEAQKIAFAPLTFQAIRALLNLGVMRAVSDAGDDGVSVRELAKKTNVSEYGIKVLSEIAVGMGVFKLKEAQGEERIFLGKIGWFLLEDNLTRVNFNFTNDICYKGAFDLDKSVANSKPEGLKVFGENWTTIYEALSTLPPQEKKSWFDFDHFYSDIAFPQALPIVYAQKPKRLLDIGGNTAKWAIASCRYDKDVHITICDLPGQTAVAEKNAAEAGFADRISTHSGNILDEANELPDAPDAVWMSQFLDCFSLAQVTKILKKIHSVATKDTSVYILEPLWDKQKFEAESFSLQATSLYFTCMANGNSKMYRYGELVEAVCAGGFELKAEYHELGSNYYSLLVFGKK